MEVLWFFNNQMLGIGNAPAYVPAPQGYGDGSETGLMTMLTDDMCQLDARVADHQFHINPPLLQVIRTYKFFTFRYTEPEYIMFF